MSALNTIKCQAGNRIIIGCKYEKSNFIITSHYENLEEFFRFHPKEGGAFKGKMEWYQIKGQEKVNI